ncbi:MAG: aspartate--tRNA ligase [Oscillospiraceae bacterium]|nr:aspartate--tRNA ligase [Oscillospiraceae bacterium]
METMGNLRRTHYCGTLRAADAGKEITVAGSVAKNRDKGGLVFVDLRDTSGILQLTFDENTPKAIFEKAGTLRSEYVIMAKGLVRERSAKTDKIATGDVELDVTELRILSDAEITPFEIKDGVKVRDDLRLKYRYLDLRRPEAHEPIVMRHRITKIARDYYDQNHFVEIETPIMVKSTPEGARDYLIPSRVQQGRFFALPQSPQLYKQLLMLSGFDRYMQIARCFRDEDLRADRQPEFTQIDLEMSFVDENDIMTVNEGFIKKVFKELLNEEVQTPFLRMPYKEAMSRFGSDKPDTRFGLELVDITDTVKDSEFIVFSGPISAGGTVHAINAKGLADKLTRKEIDKLVEVAKTYGAKGLAYTRLTADGETSSYEKKCTEAEVAAIRAKLDAQVGDVLLICGGEDTEEACTALGQVRLEIGKKFELFNPKQFNFLWVTEFPLFEYSKEDGRYYAKHHPFTMPMQEDMDKIESDPANARARAYDMVLNGCELGGGSIRINDPQIQKRMFRALGFTEERAQESFGFLIEAYKYGAPPHGGMAYGLDRLCMLMLGTDSIREVIAFPKVQNSGELMTGCPETVEQKQLDELAIALVQPQP